MKVEMFNFNVHPSSLFLFYIFQFCIFQLSNERQIPFQNLLPTIYKFNFCPPDIDGCQGHFASKMAIPNACGIANLKIGCFKKLLTPAVKNFELTDFGYARAAENFKKIIFAIRIWRKSIGGEDSLCAIFCQKLDRFFELAAIQRCDYQRVAPDFGFQKRWLDGLAVPKKLMGACRRQFKKNGLVSASQRIGRQKIGLCDKPDFHRIGCRTSLEVASQRDGCVFGNEPNRVGRTVFPGYFFKKEKTGRHQNE